MRFFYSDTFDIPLPAKHRFPGSKYSQLRLELLQKGIVAEEQLLESPQATRADFVRVHDPNYVDGFLEGTLEDRIMRRIGFPWSPHLVKRISATMGGAIAAAEQAIETGLSGQLAGGTHHAHYDFGAGYCVFNDFALAAFHLLSTHAVDRVAILDLDVHQGDGNSALLKNHPQVFVASLHGEKNFPFRKHLSDWDGPLPDGCDDETYLRTLDEALAVVDAFAPDIVLYQAGVDVLKVDKLGRLDLTYEGLWKRDLRVLSHYHKKGIPVSMAIGGGYADPIEQSVKGYVQTYAVAKQFHGF